MCGHRDDELLEKLLPTYPPFCGRVLVDNEWVASLRRPNVNLVPFQVSRIHPDGLEAADGKTYPAETIIYSTGACGV